MKVQDVGLYRERASTYNNRQEVKNIQKNIRGGNQMKYENLKVKLFADGANLEDMLDAYKEGKVKGFTTNPSLMKKAGITDYKSFAKEVLEKIQDMPVSFEVFSDDFATMEKEADVLANLAKNVYVKIPVTNTKGESSVPLIKKLSAKGYHLNVTAIFTLEQVKVVVAALNPEVASIVSVFSGRIADTGIDAKVLMKEAHEICKQNPKAELLWASCREFYNIIDADECDCEIITVQNEFLAKIKNMGKDLNEYSLETVRGFYKDASSLGFSVL
jgi:transaldolase